VIRQYPDPRTGTDIARWPFGINVVDDIATMDQRYAQKMDNMEYRKGTPWRRPPFLAKSTQQFDAVATDAMEYIDSTGTARILWGSYDGKVKEWTAAGTHADRVTSLTVGKIASLAQMLGAAFHQNGQDRPRRGDATVWREAGAPLPAGTLALGVPSAGALTGDHIWTVTACVHDGTRVILESDHGNYMDAFLTAEMQPLTWAASADSRVNWYRLYRTQDGQGTPFFLVYEANALAYTDNTRDANLSEQVAAPLARNGRMPVSRIIAQAGNRLCCANLVDATDPNASRAVHVSIVATNRFEMEYYPDDQVHKFYLPGPGEVTCAVGYSVKDEDFAAKDLFLAQPTSCYILRGANPLGVLEPISYTKGVIGKKAAVQWGRYLFFVSREGLEFIGPEGDPILISPHANPYFLGGGPLSLAPSAADECVTLEIHGGRLLVILKDQSGLIWGNKALVLDLERLNPFNPKTDETAFYTLWYMSGGGMAFFLALRDGSLLLFDNQNRRLLQRGTTGANDVVNGANAKVRALIWTSGMMAEFMASLKVLRQINVLQLSEEDTFVDLVFDRGYANVIDQVIPRLTTETPWDVSWDVTWSEGAVFLSSLYTPRHGKGRFMQARITIENDSPDYIFIGLTLFYTAVKARRLTRR
jgi:hypothetical protein